ncbi:MAG TPA: SgcJ/EcaC family oxidoreductase [Verrucomicrobiae bacterium]|nr:SgcJ/EcaC family oxidoreductase [Verrucomicrobiae bacterium]
MSKDELAIRELVNKWTVATKAGDLQTVLTLMADDVLFLVPGREPFGKDVFAAASRSMKDFRIEGSSEIKELAVHGDWAWMRNRLVITVTPPNGKPTLRSGHTLTILRKNPDGNWVIARDANLVS